MVYLLYTMLEIHHSGREPLISSWSAKKCARKWSQRVLLYADLVHPAMVKVSESGMKWWKSMVPISIAGMKTLRCKVCAQCPALKFLPCKTAGQLPSQTQLITLTIDQISHKETTTTTTNQCNKTKQIQQSNPLWKSPQNTMTIPSSSDSQIKRFLSSLSSKQITNSPELFIPMSQNGYLMSVKAKDKKHIPVWLAAVICSPLQSSKSARCNSLDTRA